MSFTTVTVTGTFTGDSGDAASGTVEFHLQEPLSNGGTTVDTGTTTARLDSSGAISVDLVANDDTGTTPQGSQYVVTERLDGLSVREYMISVPSAATGGTCTLASLMPGHPGFG